MVTRTKIICTMGPSVNNYEKILELIEAGMNVARLNFSHGTHEDHLKVIDLLKKARDDKGVPLAIMLDTKGPEIRLGKVPGGSIEVVPNQKLYLVKQKEESGIQMTPEIVFDFLDVGATVLFDDGSIISKVIEKTEKGVFVEIQNMGTLKNQKGVNIPDVQIPLPAMTKEDIESISFGCREGVDIIAASFIRSAEHLLEIKKLLKEQGKPNTFVIAKIENIQGVQNFDDILKVADGIMVARGDLGVEMPLYEVPSLQKMMIRKCQMSAKPVITATQMLESMIHNIRPTRAEVSDVANAIYDSTSAVMLSGETAVGLYPIETVKIMRDIIVEAEKEFNYKEFFLKNSKGDSFDVSSSVSAAAVKTAYALEAKAIFVFTTTGSTARLISRYRPEIPVFSLTPTKESYHQTAILWGIIPVDPYPARNVEEAFRLISNFAKKRSIIKKDDFVLVTAGSPFGISGSTNMMIVSKLE